MKSPSKEALKELVRLVILGAVSAGLTWLTKEVSTLDPSSAYAIVGTLVLRAIDAYIHHNDNIKANGLLPF